MKTITAGITITTHPSLTSYKAGTNWCYSYSISVWQTKEKTHLLSYKSSLKFNEKYKEKPDILSDNHQLEHDGGMMTLYSTIQ